MSKRDEALRNLKSLASELPDDEIRRLELFASYLLDRGSPEGEGMNKIYIFGLDLTSYLRRRGIYGDEELLARIHNLEIALDEWGRSKIPDGSGDRLHKAEEIIRAYVSLRRPDNSIGFPSHRMIDKALAWLEEGERKTE